MTAPNLPGVSMSHRLQQNYDWTPRQREVLGLIAKRLTNTEIAEQLGLSLAGAKWHVSEILTKLQAESREEAADYWRRYNGVAPRFGRIFRALVPGLSVEVRRRRRWAGSRWRRGGIGRFGHRRQ